VIQIAGLMMLPRELKTTLTFLAMVNSLGKRYAVLCSRPRFVVPFSL